jgi:LysM repeat protein
MYDRNSNLLSKTGYSAGQLAAAVGAIRSNHGFNDFQAFVDAENQYDLNALFIVAHAAIESAWGTSYYATARNNLFGFNAVDSNPDLASSYASQRVSIIDYADFLSKYYLYNGQEFFGGAATPHGIFVHYSSSHDSEAESVVSIMNSLLSHISGQPSPVPAPTPPAPAPSGDTYTVQQGDNMSVIAQREGMSLLELEQLNPSAGHPAGNFGNIWPGDVLQVKGQPAPAPVQTAYVTVQQGENLSVIAENNGISLGQIEQLNPRAGHPAGNFDNIWPGDTIRVK